MENRIFREGSITYFWASKFFSKSVRNDVFKLYSYLRTMDNFVDQIPQQAERLAAFEAARRTKNLSQLSDVDILVAKNIIELSTKYEFEVAWLEAFYQSMSWDLGGHEYKTLDDTLAYVYGSAEVVGLMMARILGLSKEADRFACLQGRAVQFVNFLRDIDEDNQLGRSYFPAQDIERFDLKNLSKKTAILRKNKFREFIWFELERYRLWQQEAEGGFKYIPRRQLRAVKTAVDGYNWTAEQIRQDPLKIFEVKIKPTQYQLLSWAARHSISG